MIGPHYSNRLTDTPVTSQPSAHFVHDHGECSAQDLDIRAPFGFRFATFRNFKKSTAAGFEVAFHIDWGPLEPFLPLFGPMRLERESALRGMQS